MKFGLIGGGSWATAIAKLLTDNKNAINWWMRNTETLEYLKLRGHNPHYLSSVLFDKDLLLLNTNIEEVIINSDVVVICVPSTYLLSILEGLPRNIFKDKIIMSAVKGFIPQSNQLLNLYLHEHFDIDQNKYISIMGPCHAEEVAAEKLSFLTFSGYETALTTSLAAYFKTYYLNTVVNNDLWGSQLAAILKNIYAVGAGIVHGLDYGDNFLSVYIANATNEMNVFLSQVMKHMELQSQACNYCNSVYLGDLLVTCYSLHSRNRAFGNMIGKGYTVKVAQLEMNMVAEGYPATKAIYEINERVAASMPIASTIYSILYNGKSAKNAFKELQQQFK